MEKVISEAISEHRIQCSFRLLIGPLDDNSPLPFSASHQPPSSSQNNKATQHCEPLHDNDNTPPRLGAVELNDADQHHHRHPSSSNDISNTRLQHLHAPMTDSSTAQCTTTCNTKQHHSFSSQFETTPNPATSITSAKSSNFKSASRTDIIDTLNPKVQNNATTSQHDAESMSVISRENDHHHYHHQNRWPQDNTTHARPILWRNSGPVFVPPLPKRYINNNRDSNAVIKHGVLLCNRLTYHCSGKQPSVYNQQHTQTTTAAAAAPKRKQEDWRQLEIILTHGALKCYASSGLVWPKRNIQHDISLNNGGTKDSSLSLYLLSPLDYTFCIEYTPTNETGTITLVFRARSLTMSQEWYMAIYQLLPDHSRKPVPHECKIYIPSISVYVHLPLINLQSSDQQENNNNNNNNNNDDDDDRYEYDSKYLITMDHVKEATMTLLENDPDWQSALGNHNDLSLCWIRNERAEWIFWKHSVDGKSEVDMAICPQNIEKTHRLELRPTQHTPHTIILADDTVLKEPYPCEGFLTKMTSFEGRRIKLNTCTPNRFYFAAFDGFLFVIPGDKAVAPHTRTYVDPATQLSLATNDRLHHQHQPFVTLVTPFADSNSSRLLCGWQQEELNRRMKLISNAISCINLTEVAFVQRSSLASHDDGDGTTHYYADGSYTNVSIDLLASSTSTTTSLLTHGDEPSLSSSLLSDRQHYWDEQQHGIDLVMENGIIIKLEAYSGETCNQWITSLSDLVLYAKARLEADRDMHGDNVNNTSLADSGTKMSEKGDTDSAASGSSASHHGTPSTNHFPVDTRIWSLCLFTQCRDIAKFGILYVQSKSKGVFSQKQFILTADGRLHYFNVFKRLGDDGQPIQTGIHERKGTLDMANAYIYSGMMSTFDNKSSQTRADRLARLFDNGIATNDSDESCLFTIWIPQRRRVYSPRRQCIITYEPDRRFNSTGQTWLFMALSRQDKEAWMWAISIIQEQLLRTALK